MGEISSARPSSPLYLYFCDLFVPHYKITRHLEIYYLKHVICKSLACLEWTMMAEGLTFGGLSLEEDLTCKVAMIDVDLPSLCS